MVRIVVHDVWSVGEAYEAYVGRWSRVVAQAFLSWLDVPAGRRWLDAGCGTGALTASILALADPAEVIGVDTSEGFLASARAQVVDGRAAFVSGEFARVAVSGAVIAAYVWDYAEGMAMMRHFWDAATVLDSKAAELDEGRRFPVCRPGPLADLWAAAGLDRVTVEAIEAATLFADFDDYWMPFLGGQGPAPGYVASLTDEHRRALCAELYRRLPRSKDGTIALTARAWAVRGTAS
jgi:SAM-dependent methyltransferase